MSDIQTTTSNEEVTTIVATTDVVASDSLAPEVIDARNKHQSGAGPRGRKQARIAQAYLDVGFALHDQHWHFYPGGKCGRIVRHEIDQIGLHCGVEERCERRWNA